MSPSRRLTKPSVLQRPGNAHHSGNVLHRYRRYHCLDVAHFIFYFWEIFTNIDTLKKLYRLFILSPGHFIQRWFVVLWPKYVGNQFYWQSIL